MHEQETAPSILSSDLTLHGDVNALFAAIAKARAKFAEVTKDATGQAGMQKFLYTPLATLTAASVPYLSEVGVVVMQFLSSPPELGGRHRLTTIVAGCGGRIESRIDFTPAVTRTREGEQQDDIKSYGKQTTYLRRYAYNAIFVLDGEKDADADADTTPSGMGRGQQQTQQRPQPRRDAPPPSQPAQPRQQALPAAAPAEKPAPVAAPSERPPAPRPATIPPPAPENVGEVTADQHAAIKALLDAMGMGKPERVAVCQRITGVLPNQLTHDQANNLLNELRGMAAAQGVA